MQVPVDGDWVFGVEPCDAAAEDLSEYVTPVHVPTHAAVLYFCPGYAQMVFESEPTVTLASSSLGYSKVPVTSSGTEYAPEA
jgi:hypothetical protein